MQMRSLLGTERAERRRRNEKLPFCRFDRLDLHSVVAFASLVNLDAKIIDLASFGGERGGRADAFRGFLENARLPLRTYLMIARVHLKGKIRFPLVRADPGTIEPHAHGRASFDVFYNINQGLARLRLRDRVILFVGAHIELRLVWAAPSARRDC